MPPKKSSKRKGKKDKKKDKKEPVQDELDRMTEEQLKEELKRHEALLEEVQRNRNYYQLEKDQMQDFYAVTKQEVMEAEAHIRNLESQMERIQEAHRNDIRIYLQKVVHLEYEQENNVEAVKAKAEAAHIDEQKRQEERLLQLNQIKTQLMEKLKAEELSTEEEIKNLRDAEHKEIVKLREEFEANFQQLQHNYKANLEQLKADLELQRKMEIHEIEERKNRHINELMDNHDQAFNEIRDYYNSITRDNLGLIKKLKAELVSLKNKAEETERTYMNVQEKNEQLVEPCERAKERVASLQQKLMNFDKDKATLKHARARVLVLEDKLKALNEEYEATKALFKKVEHERNQLYETFEKTITVVQRRADRKNETLADQLQQHQMEYESKKAQLEKVMAEAKLDPTAIGELTSRLDKVISQKDEESQRLEYECSKVQKAHNDLVNVFEAKLREQGVPESELGVRETLSPQSSS